MSGPPPIPPAFPQKTPPPLPTAGPRTNGFAIASLVLSVPAAMLQLLGVILMFFGIFAFFFAVPGIICGHVALGQIKRGRGLLTGKPLAVTALCLSYSGIAFFIVYTVFAVIIFGGAIKDGFKKAQAAKEKPSVPVAQIVDPAVTPLPVFPELPAAQPLGESPIRIMEVDFAPANRGPNRPAGSKMKLRVYLPPGEHAPHSLPCVLVAPAGTNLLVGNMLDFLDADLVDEDEESFDEMVPYAKAGMVAIQYSLDGAQDDDAEDEEKDWSEAYKAFRAAGAGAVNARNALEFALQRLPMVHPERIFSAGHSSAGTVSLLFAAHEPRLRGCIAYAPATDVEEQLEELSSDLRGKILFPQLDAFIRGSSPLNHTARLGMPVFLFHAKDDDTVPYAAVVSFKEKLELTNSSVTLMTQEEGGHYDPMMEKGIPAAIHWIHKILALPPVSAASAAEKDSTEEGN
jgi:dienelactone hydrolase